MWLSSDHKVPSTFIYFDGEIAQPHVVQIKIENRKLHLSSEGRRLQTLLVDDLTVVANRGHPSGSLALSLRDREEARLIIPNDALPMLFRFFPDLDPKGIIHRRKKRREAGKWVGSIIGVVFLALLLLGPGIGLVIRFIPRNWEDRLGGDLLIDFIKKDKECREANGLEALKKLQKRLWRDSENPPPNINVVSNPIVNALALPGNQILIFEGLLKETLKSSELAGVLAHEMAHINQRHPLQLWLRSTIIEDAAAFLGMSSIVPFLALNHYSSEMEADADDGAYYMLKTAGINKNGLADFFRRLEEKEGSVLEKIPFLSSHPPLAERAQKAGEDQGSEGEEALSVKDWMALKKICHP